MPKPPPIRVLDDLTASRIAAGEVVERPASVVKELVENSLDAGATDVRVEIQSGGRRLIRVTDNGQGIGADEAELAFQRHATSKIACAEDLEHIATLGFRGEALASIAAVSHVTLITRASAQATGVQLRLAAGRVTSREAIGSPVGTILTAENLFHAVPARLKFLRSEATEFGHIHDLVTRYALAYPDRRFLLVRDGRTMFQSPGTGEVEDALIAVFGVDVAREMIPIHLDVVADNAALAEGASFPIAISGYVSPPHIHRATRQHITLFVNGRWVQDTALMFAVVQAYHTLLPVGRYPVAVVRVALPPAVVDVNVHPAKTEIRFCDSRPVFRAVQQAVRSALVGGSPVAPFGQAPAEGGPWAPRPARDPHRDQLAVSPTPVPARQGTFLDREGVQLPLLRVVGQVAQTYIVAEGPDGLYLIDQHAAHERVMYERMTSQRGQVQSQPLLVPEAVSLSPAELAVIEAHADTFATLGFEVEPFGADTALVRALPDGLATTDVPRLVRAVVDAAIEGGSALEDAFEEILMRAVCKQATVKAGHTMSLEEMRSLVQKLEATTSPRTCPHGRPTMIVLGNDRLAREFGRG
jgi:DNA mismatch repair protein MutL